MEAFKDLPIGIDLGTTFSCIGVYRNASVEIIPNEKGDRTTPSVVSFLDDQIFVGEQTEYKRLKDQKNKIYAIKRIIGRNYDDKEVQDDINDFSYKIENDNGRPQIIVDSNGIQKFSPEEISAKILAKLKASAEDFLQQTIKKVVITVPAYFTERQKQATKNAGEIAGLEVIKIINEPTAAALAYGFGRCQNTENKLLGILGKKTFYYTNVENSYRTYDTNNSDNLKKDFQNIIIYDLGGGTLDVSLLELEKDDITIKAHSGRMHLGGEDIDNILMKYCIEYFKQKTKIDLNQEEFLKSKIRLKEHCENAKKRLTYQDETVIEVESIAGGKDLNLKLTRAKFNDLCESIFKECLEPIKEVLEISGEDKTIVDEIVLVGGSTKIPKIQTNIEEFIGKKILNIRLNPDEAIAYGATIEAAILMGKYTEDITLLDVCPFSLGVGIEKEQYYDKYGLYMRKIINKGTKLPCKINQIFHPAHENSTSLIIQIYEGDNKFVKDNYPLGKFELLDIPKKKKDEINIDVTFELDEDSILTVTAVIKENNYSNSLTIKNDKGGLSKNEIEKAKSKQKAVTTEDNLEPGIVMERNYKNEIHELINKINNSVNPNTQYFYLHNLKYTIEKFLDTFDKNDDNYTLQEKKYYYLTILFNVYSSILVFDKLLSEEEKNDIISRVKEYLQFFERKGLSYASSLIKLFYGNEDKIFAQFSVQVLGYYSQKGTEYYSSNEKKYAKHYLEEALMINKKYSVESRVCKVKNNEELLISLNSILENCKELITILKVESIDKYCKSFSNNNLIKEDEFTNDEQKLDILDRFKEAQLLLKDSKKREDKLLKAIYLANIIKIEYKMFNSNDYDTLLKMIEDCISLKVQVPKGCINDTLEWFNEICKYKLEIEEKLEALKENPKIEEKDIKEELKDIAEEINNKFNEGRINFFFYILSKHKPNGIEEDMVFNNIDELKNHYDLNEKKFLKQLRKLYNPTRYLGDKEEQRKVRLIMREIQIKINSLK